MKSGIQLKRDKKAMFSIERQIEELKACKDAVEAPPQDDGLMDYHIVNKQYVVHIFIDLSNHMSILTIYPNPPPDKTRYFVLTDKILIKREVNMLLSEYLHRYSEYLV